jgi:hypothetical protein
MTKTTFKATITRTMQATIATDGDHCSQHPACPYLGGVGVCTLYGVPLASKDGYLRCPTCLEQAAEQRPA